jgi:hypothetical protein
VRLMCALRVLFARTSRSVLVRRCTWGDRTDYVLCRPGSALRCAVPRLLIGRLSVAQTVDVSLLCCFQLSPSRFTISFALFSGTTCRLGRRTDGVHEDAVPQPERRVRAQ